MHTYTVNAIFLTHLPVCSDKTTSLQDECHFSIVSVNLFMGWTFLISTAKRLRSVKNVKKWCSKHCNTSLSTSLTLFPSPLNVCMTEDFCTFLTSQAASTSSKPFSLFCCTLAAAFSHQVLLFLSFLCFVLRCIFLFQAWLHSMYTTALTFSFSGSRTWLCTMTSRWHPAKGKQQVVGFSSSGSPAGKASASGIWSLISPSCLKFLIEYLQYQPLYGWRHAAVLWLPFLTLTTCLVSAESVTHTRSPSYISMSVFVQLHTSSIWLHLAVLIHGFSDKGNTGRGQISPAEDAASSERGC